MESSCKFKAFSGAYKARESSFLHVNRVTSFVRVIFKFATLINERMD